MAWEDYENEEMLELIENQTKELVKATDDAMNYMGSIIGRIEDLTKHISHWTPTFNNSMVEHDDLSRRLDVLNRLTTEIPMAIREATQSVLRAHEMIDTELT